MVYFKFNPNNDQGHKIGQAFIRKDGQTDIQMEEQPDGRSYGQT